MNAGLAVAVFLSTTLLAIGATRGALWFAKARQILDHPNWRSSHTRPTPRGGGLGILAAFLVGVGVAAWLPEAGVRDRTALLVTAGAALLLAAVGYRDDRSGTSPLVKMPLQALAAGAVVWAVGPVTSVSLPGASVGLGVLAVPLSIVWLVGFSNAYNFMDGIDGIAGLFGAIAAAFLFVAARLGGAGAADAIAVPLAGACLGFLAWNWHPARIFMGDVGSLPVGFLLAAAALIGHQAGEIPFPAAFLVLGPFLFDTIVTVVARLERGENVFAAHRSHLYQRLVVAGLGHSRVSLIYGAWSVLTGGLGLLYVSGGIVSRIVALGAALLSGAAVWLLVVRLEGRRGKT